MLQLNLSMSKDFDITTISIDIQLLALFGLEVNHRRRFGTTLHSFSENFGTLTASSGN